MPNLASWIRPRDEELFAPFFAMCSAIQLHNAARGPVVIEEMDGLLLTGGADIAPEFLRQPVPDRAVLEKPEIPRDEWEFAAVSDALERGLPILAICKGMQLLNVALGGTLRLDIPGHNLPEQEKHDIQPLRHDGAAVHRFDHVNSSHHQAIDRLGEGCVVESWCATDDVIEQLRLRDHPYALAVQYHPERGTIYGGLFEEFFAKITTRV
jgi:putative glutamine amidotransferase